MADPVYAYSGKPVQNPLRYALALWRTVRDPSNTSEVAIVEIGALRSRTGRRFVKPGQMLEVLARDPRTAERVREMRPFGPIDFSTLSSLPAGSFGRVVADHLAPRGLDPNLVELPTDEREGLFIHNLYATHDLWHVVTGWGSDLDGETGLAGFYAAQLAVPPFFALGFALLILNAIFFQPTALRSRVEAWSAGWEMGLSAEPLFGLDWTNLWALPIDELRAQLRLDPAGIVGEGISLAA